MDEINTWSTYIVVMTDKTAYVGTTCGIRFKPCEDCRHKMCKILKRLKDNDVVLEEFKYEDLEPELFDDAFQDRIPSLYPSKVIGFVFIATLNNENGLTRFKESLDKYLNNLTFVLKEG